VLTGPGLLLLRFFGVIMLRCLNKNKNKQKQHEK